MEPQFGGNVPCVRVGMLRQQRTFSDHPRRLSFKNAALTVDAKLYLPGVNLSLPPCRCGVGCVVFGVIGQMATLAPSAKIRRVTVLGIVVKVGNGQNNAAASDLVRLAVDGAAIGIGWRAFTAVSGAG